MVDAVVDVELAGRCIQAFDARLFLQGLGVEDHDFTVRLEAVRTIPDGGPDLGAVLVELDMDGRVAFFLRQTNGLVQGCVLNSWAGFSRLSIHTAGQIHGHPFDATTLRNHA